MSSLTLADRPLEPPSDTDAVRKVAVASLIGTTIEWYDFLIYGSLAGLIFNKQFFPSDSAFVSTMLAYGTFAAGFIVRPFGGLVFGHFGDRIGRKPLLVLTLMIMGAATVLMGLLPTYAQIGVLSPILLLALRMIQGFAIGGEWGGAVIMAYEYAPRGQTNYYASFPQMGLAIGLCAGAGVLSLLSAMLTDAQFSAWGWRIAFMFSVLLLVVGLFIRLRVVETPAFLEAKRREEVVRTPIVDVVRDEPVNVVLGWGARMIDGVIFAVYAIFTLTFLVKLAGMPRTTVLAAISAASFVLIFTIPMASALADRVGAKRLYILFSLLLGASSFPAMWLMQYSGSVAIAVFCIVVVMGVLYAPVYGPQAAIFCELFSTRIRYSGISIVYQIGAIFFVSLTPMIATYLLHANGDRPWLIAAYMTLSGVVSALCIALMRKPKE
ncbi:MAG: MFS transporter [Candidimonas sp.]|nr:MAG: MFS transporter [Candidimonas sp.]